MQEVSHPNAAIEFEELQAILKEIGIEISAAELHGYQTGLLSLGMELNQILWWEQFFTDYPFAGRDTLKSEDRQAILNVLEQTQNDLDSNEFGFDLLLPDDDASLILRVESIANWCSGYLSGFQTAVTLVSPAVRDKIQSSEQIKEILVDLSAIRQVETLEISEVEDLLETERNYAEITEYVRVAVMNVSMDIKINALSNDGSERQDKPTLH